MPKGSELKRGMILDIDGVPHAIRNIEVKSPSSRGAATLYKVRFSNLKTKQKLEQSYKGDDVLREADCVRIEVQFSYTDGDNLVFMDTSDYTQYTLPEQEVEDVRGYLTEGLDGIVALLLDDELMTIELPSSVQLPIVDTVPCIKGAVASARTKPARLSTGLEIQVPEYLEVGELIKINTQSGKFMSRA